MGCKQWPATKRAGQKPGLIPLCGRAVYIQSMATKKAVSGRTLLQAERTKKIASFTLSDEEREMLDELAQGMNKSAVVGTLIRQAHARIRKK